MPTVRKMEVFTHERAGRVLAGATMLLAVALGFLHHPGWLLVAAGTGLNLVLSGITDCCAVKRLLIRMGFPGERDVGRAEAIRSSRPASSAKAASRPGRAATHEEAAVN